MSRNGYDNMSMAGFAGMNPYQNWPSPFEMPTGYGTGSLSAPYGFPDNSMSLADANKNMEAMMKQAQTAAPGFSGMATLMGGQIMLPMAMMFGGSYIISKLGGALGGGRAAASAAASTTTAATSSILSRIPWLLPVTLLAGGGVGAYQSGKSDSPGWGFVSGGATAVGGTLLGAKIGAAIGSGFPGIGTLIGAAVGAGIGLGAYFCGQSSHNSEQAQQAATQKQQETANAQRQLQSYLATAYGGGSGFGAGFPGISGAFPMGGAFPMKMPAFG